MRRLVIAIDCDDVLIPTTEFTVNTYNKKYNTSVKLHEAHSPVNPEWAQDRSVVHARIHAIQTSDQFREIQPFQGAIDVIKKLASTHELHLVTARQRSVDSVTRQMLDKYFPDCFVSMEHVGMDGTKGDICAKIGADVLVDDNVAHLQNAFDHGMSMSGLLWFGRYSWQPQSSEISGQLATRHSDWHEIGKAIDRLAAERGQLD